MGRFFFLSKRSLLRLLCFPFPVFPFAFVSSAGRGLPSSCRLAFPVTSSYSSRTSMRAPMRSCLTWGNRLGRRTPHLTEDASWAPAAAPSSAPPRGQIHTVLESPLRRGSGLRVLTARCPASSPAPPPCSGPSATATDQWPVASPAPRPFSFSRTPRV